MAMANAAATVVSVTPATNHRCVRRRAQLLSHAATSTCECPQPPTLPSQLGYQGVPQGCHYTIVLSKIQQTQQEVSF